MQFSAEVLSKKAAMLFRLDYSHQLGPAKAVLFSASYLTQLYDEEIRKKTQKLAERSSFLTERTVESGKLSIIHFHLVAK